MIIVVCAIIGFVGWRLTDSIVTQAAHDRWRVFEDGGMFFCGAPSESSDGERIVFASACSGDGDIYVVDRMTGATTRLTSSDFYESTPVYLPGCRRIAFTRQRDGRRHLWLMDEAGNDERQITHGNVQDDVFSVSPNGRFAIILRRSLSINSFIGHGRQAKILVCSLEPGMQLPFDVGRYSVFSPDGNSIVFCDQNHLVKSLSLNDQRPRETDLG
jgi:Tol biopolymer transport system component